MKRFLSIFLTLALILPMIPAAEAAQSAAPSISGTITLPAELPADKQYDGKVTATYHDQSDPANHKTEYSVPFSVINGSADYTIEVPAGLTNGVYSVCITVYGNGVERLYSDADIFAAQNGGTTADWNSRDIAAFPAGQVVTDVDFVLHTGYQYYGTVSPAASLPQDYPYWVNVFIVRPNGSMYGRGFTLDKQDSYSIPLPDSLSMEYVIALYVYDTGDVPAGVPVETYLYLAADGSYTTDPQEAKWFSPTQHTQTDLVIPQWDVKTISGEITLAPGLPSGFYDVEVTAEHYADGAKYPDDDSFSTDVRFNGSSGTYYLNIPDHIDDGYFTLSVRARDTAPQNLDLRVAPAHYCDDGSMTVLNNKAAHITPDQLESKDYDLQLLTCYRVYGDMEPATTLPNYNYRYHLYLSPVNDGVSYGSGFRTDRSDGFTLCVDPSHAGDYYLILVVDDAPDGVLTGTPMYLTADGGFSTDRNDAKIISVTGHTELNIEIPDQNPVKNFSGSITLAPGLPADLYQGIVRATYHDENDPDNDGRVFCAPFNFTGTAGEYELDVPAALTDGYYTLELEAGESGTDNDDLRVTPVHYMADGSTGILRSEAAQIPADQVDSQPYPFQLLTCTRVMGTLTSPEGYEGPVHVMPIPAHEGITHGQGFGFPDHDSYVICMDPSTTRDYYVAMEIERKDPVPGEPPVQRFYVSGPGKYSTELEDAQVHSFTQHTTLDLTIPVPPAPVPTVNLSGSVTLPADAEYDYAGVFVHFTDRSGGFGDDLLPDEDGGFKPSYSFDLPGDYTGNYRLSLVLGLNGDETTYYYTQTGFLSTDESEAWLFPVDQDTTHDLLLTAHTPIPPINLSGDVALPTDVDFDYAGVFVHFNDRSGGFGDDLLPDEEGGFDPHYSFDLPRSYTGTYRLSVVLGLNGAETTYYLTSDGTLSTDENAAAALTLTQDTLQNLVVAPPAKPTISGVYASGGSDPDAVVEAAAAGESVRMVLSAPVADDQTRTLLVPVYDTNGRMVDLVLQQVTFSNGVAAADVQFDADPQIDRMKAILLDLTNFFPCMDVWNSTAP